MTFDDEICNDAIVACPENIMDDFQPPPDEPDYPNADQSADQTFSSTQELKTPEGSKADVQSESQIQSESPSKSSSPKKIDSSNEAIETETNDCVDEHNSSRDSNIDVTGMYYRLLNKFFGNLLILQRSVV